MGRTRREPERKINNSPGKKEKEKKRNFLFHIITSTNDKAAKFPAASCISCSGFSFSSCKSVENMAIGLKRKDRQCGID